MYASAIDERGNSVRSNLGGDSVWTGLCPGTHSQSWWFSSNIHSLCCIGTVGSMDLRAWVNGLISAGSELSVPVGQFSKSHSFAVIAVTNRYGDNWIIRQEHFMVSYYVTVGGI